MKAIMRLTTLALLGTVAWAGEKFTKEQLAALYHWDLGPKQIDVSAYPEMQRQRYEVFAQTCAQCHTLARPINAPFTKRKDWDRYVKRMHVRQKVRNQDGFFKEEAQVIVDFLVYDAAIRKIKNNAGFQTRDKDLMVLFDEVQKERGRIHIEEDKKKVKDMPPGETGVHPYPKPQ